MDDNALYLINQEAEEMAIWQMRLFEDENRSSHLGEQNSGLVMKYSKLQYSSLIFIGTSVVLFLSYY